MGVAVADRRLSVGLCQTGPIPLDAEFSCEPGNVLAIFGPSGSGKTTVGYCVNRLYEPTALGRRVLAAWTAAAQHFSPRFAQ